MSKTLVCTNVLDSVKSQAYGSHCQEWFRLGRDTKDDFVLFHPERYSIDTARNQAAKYAMLLECDYIWFLDDDMVLSPKTYQSLKGCDGDVVMALTFIRGLPFNPMFFRKDNEYESDPRNLNLVHYNDWVDKICNNGTIHTYAVGFACTLLKVDRLFEMPPPYFITSSLQTEDIYYCCKLKQHDPGARILVDSKVPTGHLLAPEMISLKTRDKLLEFYKEEIEINKQSKLDRGEEYFEEVKIAFK